MIIPKKIEEQTVEHFSPEGISLGFLTYLESLDLRVQILENRASGYYLIFNGEKIEISPEGRSKIPKNMFDHYTNLLTKLMGF